MKQKMMLEGIKKGDRVARDKPDGRIIPALVEKATPAYIWLDRGQRFRRDTGEQYGGVRRYGLGKDRIRPITFQDLAEWNAKAERQNRARIANGLAHQIYGMTNLLTDEDLGAIAEILRQAEERPRPEES